MRLRLHGRKIALLVATLAAFQWSLTAQTPAPQSKRPLAYTDVDYWKSIQGTRLSHDGQWLAYALTSQAEDGEVIVRQTAGTQEFRSPRGNNPTFTPDGKFMIFTILPPKSEEEEEEGQEGRGGAEPEAGAQPAGRGGAAANDNQPRNSLGIMALPSGEVTTIEKVGSYRIPEEASTWIAYYKGTGGGGPAAAGGRGGRGGGAPAAGGGRQGGAQGRGQATGAERRKAPGSDLILRNLASGEEITIPEVVEYQWNKKGDWIAYSTSSPEAEKDGAFARRMSDGAVTTLHSGRGHYKSLVFDEEGTQLAFLSDQAEYDKPVSPYRLYLWKAGDAQAAELVSASTSGMGDGMGVSDNAPPRFSRDGARLFLGTAPIPPAPPDGTPRRPIPVDIWSTRDALLQPMQSVRANQERNRSFRAVVHLADRRFVQLATTELPEVNPTDDPGLVMGTSDVPYQMEISWDTRYSDVFLVSLADGKPQRVLEKWAGGANMSPDGKYLIYFDREAGHWFSHRTADGARVNLTGKIDASFQSSNNTPSLPGPYGVAGWTAGDNAVLLNDQYDVWEVQLDGRNARSVTGGEGRKTNTIFRYRSIDPDERVVPANRPLFFSATDERTRATGFYRKASLAASTAPEKVVMLDKSFGALTKARNADTVVFTLSRFDEFPDLWLSDLTFRDMKKVSDANPQQASINWGRSEMIDYINADGIPLRAILTKPEDFDPNKKYPLMVYIYEELTQGLHSYSAPNVATSINIPRYVSNGYIVLRPDIVYSVGFPGESAEKCVIPAVNTVVAQGYIDPERIGIQGHSWGGYQITHLITRTNMFAAVQAGASVSNMISAYGGIRWGSGMVRQFQYERTQSRIGAPPWERPLHFIENSPIFWVERVETPYLTIHNDADDAVPWYQGIEFITALRRVGKEGYMFNYNGELHGLRNRDNQKHWTVHQDEFFDHYLLGKPRPEWMDKGVPFLERGTRDVSPLFKRETRRTTNDSASARR
jgi:dipeptidyl aminopeptidase/acylaminoacyl peptidase